MEKNLNNNIEETEVDKKLKIIIEYLHADAEEVSIVTDNEFDTPIGYITIYSKEELDEQIENEEERITQDAEDTIYNMKSSDEFIFITCSIDRDGIYEYVSNNLSDFIGYGSDPIIYKDYYLFESN